MQNVNDLQKRIMEYVMFWVKTQKTPIPQKEIIETFEKNGIKSFTVTNALNVLIRKRYIRKAYTVPNKVYKVTYVMLRGV